MTTPARATILGLALLLAACGDAPGGDAPDDGAKFFATGNCASCHAKDGSGGPLGPPLRGLAEHWTRESLAAYLADPKGTLASDARLQEVSKRFSMHMPPLQYTLEQRLALADHVLALSAAAK